jgi:hypothetical protein
MMRPAPVFQGRSLRSFRYLRDGEFSIEDAGDLTRLDAEINVTETSDWPVQYDRRRAFLPLLDDIEVPLWPDKRRREKVSD